MYQDEAKCETNVSMALGGQVVGQRSDRTVSENIDAKIAMLKAEIDRLEKSKETLAPLMHMRIRDIREAMNY